MHKWPPSGALNGRLLHDRRGGGEQEDHQAAANGKEVLRLPHRPVVAVLLAGGLAAASFQAAGGAAADHTARTTETRADALAGRPASATPYRPLTHRAVPEDRYAMAGGCYDLRTKDGRYVVRRN